MAKTPIAKQYAAPQWAAPKLKKPDPNFRPDGKYRVAKEYVETMTREQMKEALEKEKATEAPPMESYAGSIYNQGSIGSCAAEAGCGGLSFVRVQAGFPHVEFNPYSVYCFTGNSSQRRRHPDQGSSLIETIDWLQTHGVVPAEDWPREHGVNRRPPEEIRRKGLAYRIAEAFPITSDDEMRTFLFHRIPVLYASDVHAKLAIRMIDMDAFVYLNSWGVGWGDDGFGVEKINHVEGDYGRYAIRVSTVPEQIQL